MNSNIGRRLSRGRSQGFNVATPADLPRIAPENEWRWVGNATTHQNPGRWYRFIKGKWGPAFPDRAAVRVEARQ